MSDPAVVPEPTPIPTDATFVAHIDWEGVKIKLPAEADDLDADALEAFENGKAIGSLRAMLGSIEYDKARKQFEKLHGRRPAVRDVNALVDLIAKHFGFEDAGE